jgi:hypothetical protein
MSGLRLALAVVGISLAACYTGPSAQDFAPAISPHGVWTILMLDRASTTLAGELLEVRDSGLVVDQRPGIALVRFRSIRTVWYAKFSPANVSIARRAPSAAAIAELRLVSRFPTGVPAVVLNAMLLKADQRELKVY